MLENVLNGKITALYSDEIFDEYKSVLARKKFNFSPNLVEILLNFIKQNGICITPKSTGVKLIDNDDLPFYEVFYAKKSKNAFLITGNIKHFPKDDFILTPREFLQTTSL